MQTEPGLLGHWLDIYWRWKLVVITGMFAAICAFAVSIMLPPIYQATSVFYAPQNISAPDYIAGSATMAQTPFVPATEEKAASISIGILRSQDVFRKLATEFPERSQGQLQKNTSIDVSREFMIEVVVRDGDPQLAASIANRFPDLLRGFQQAQIREHMEGVATAARNELAAIDARLAELRSAPEGLARRQPAVNLAGSMEVEGDVTAGSFGGAADSELRATAARLRAVLLEAITQSREPAARVVVVQQAVPGRRPVFPITLLNVIVAGITGLVFGCYYALFCGYLDRRRQLRTMRNVMSPALGDKEFAALRQAMRSSP